MIVNTEQGPRYITPPVRVGPTPLQMAWRQMAWFRMIKAARRGRKVQNG